MVNRNYTEDIKTNSEIARLAEDIAIQLLHQIKAGYKFASLHDDAAMWHYGDILGTDNKYYDAKDDGVVYRTGNIFAEERKLWYNNGKVTDGWMQSGHYDYLCIVDRVYHNMYVLDFKKLKKIYKNYRRVETDMGDNLTAGYCVPLRECRKYGVLLYEVQYVYDDDMQCYDAVGLI